MKTSFKQKVIEHLDAGKSIKSDQAKKLYGIDNLRSVMASIKRVGYGFKCEFEDAPTHKPTQGRFRITTYTRTTGFPYKSAPSQLNHFIYKRWV